MSHFAKVLNGIVTQVIVAEQEFFDTFVDSSPGEWIQTSYNTYGGQHPEGRPLRKNYAGIEFNYDRANDAFYAPQPYPSWILDKETYLWNPPIPCPDDINQYKWDEDNLNWIKEE